jgi:hypothetical protein
MPNVSAVHDFVLTDPANRRMSAMRVSPADVDAVLVYGRSAWTRGARIFAIGSKEIDRYRKHGLLLHRLEGLQVVTSPDRSVLTVYRNRDLRGLRNVKGRTRRARP